MSGHKPTIGETEVRLPQMAIVCAVCNTTMTRSPSPNQQIVFFLLPSVGTYFVTFGGQWEFTSRENAFSLALMFLRRTFRRPSLGLNVRFAIATKVPERYKSFRKLWGRHQSDIFKTKGRERKETSDNASVNDVSDLVRS
eukprot:scaffold25413_cov113-Cylindrotheca_fusiformis.AAC.4